MPAKAAKSAVPESVLKKRKRQEKWDEENRAKSAAAATAGTAKKAEAFKRAEQYVKEYREQEQQLVTMKRAARKAGTFYVEPEQKVLFVMRLRGINGIHPKTRHILKVLRLLQMHNGVFMKVNKATLNMLVKVDPYIMYGYPNLKTVSSAAYLASIRAGQGARAAVWTSLSDAAGCDPASQWMRCRGRQPAERSCARKFEPGRGGCGAVVSLLGWQWQCSRRAVQCSSGRLPALGLR